jgi:hypothetical protein
MNIKNKDYRRSGHDTIAEKYFRALTVAESNKRGISAKMDSMRGAVHPSVRCV